MNNAYLYAYLSMLVGIVVCAFRVDETKSGGFLPRSLPFLRTFLVFFVFTLNPGEGIYFQSRRFRRNRLLRRRRRPFPFRLRRDVHSSLQKHPHASLFRIRFDWFLIHRAGAKTIIFDAQSKKCASILMMTTMKTR